MKHKKIKKETKRLIIRPLTICDYKVYKKSHENAFPNKNIWDRSQLPSRNLTKKSFLQKIKQQQEARRTDSLYVFGVFNKKTGEYLGSFAIMDVVRKLTFSAYLGYEFINTYWRKGYAREAILASFDIAFNELELHRLQAGIEKENMRSIKFAKSLGMRKEGLQKRIIRLRDDWRDLIIYSITSEEIGIAWKETTKKVK